MPRTRKKTTDLNAKAKLVPAKRKKAAPLSRIEFPCDPQLRKLLDRKAREFGMTRSKWVVQALRKAALA